MNSKFLVIVPLLVVIAVSGCTSFPDIFGGNVIKVNSRVTEEGNKNPLIIKDIMTLPSSPLLPDQEVILSFVVKNTDTIHTIKSIAIDLFNAPGFHDPSTKKLCNSGIGICRPEGQDYVCKDKKPCEIPSLLPGEERLVQFRMLAPSREQIANIKTQARLDFKVLYDFEGTMNFVVPAVNKEEVIRRQREGETMSITFDKSFSSGPIRIDVEPMGANYLLDNFETVFLFKVQNVGSGNLLNSSIPVSGSVSSLDCYNQCMQTYGDASYCISQVCGQDSTKGLQITFPPEIQVTVEGSMKEIFGSPTYTSSGQQLFNNKKIIQIFRDASQTSMRFPVKLAPSTYADFLSNGIPFRTYEVRTHVSYTYELRDGADVTINSWENV